MPSPSNPNPTPPTGSRPIPKLTSSKNLVYTERLIETRASGVFMKTLAKCYKDQDQNQGQGKDHNINGGGIVLMFAHGTGHHKEHWEPTVSRLFKLQFEQQRRQVEEDHQQQRQQQRRQLNQNQVEDANLIGPDFPAIGIKLKEAWAVDCQNHGEAAVLNEGLISDDPRRWSSWDYADAFASLRVELGKDESYRNDKFVLVAHSASACAAVLTTTFFPTPHLLSRAFHALILIEPAICPPHLIADAHQTDVYRAIAQMTPMRKDVWSSREEAREWFCRRLPWKMWDGDVLDVLMEHGLRKFPTAPYPSYPSSSTSPQPPSSRRKEAVTLKTPKLIEIIAYERGMQQAIPAIWRLNQICGKGKVGKARDRTRTWARTRDHGRLGEGKGLKDSPSPTKKEDEDEDDLGLVGGLDGGVHLVWGEIDDMFSREFKDALEDPSQGRNFASVTRVEGAGHLIVQQDPQRLAEVVWDVLGTSFGVQHGGLEGARGTGKPVRESRL